MTKIENQNQYEWAVKRVEDLLPLVKDDTPLNDPNSINIQLFTYFTSHFQCRLTFSGNVVTKTRRTNSYQL